MVRTLAGTGQAELIVKKSKFLARATPVEGWPEAEQVLREVRLQCGGARHHAYALRLGEAPTERQSDDGEPSGTAGLPVLNLLRAREVTQALVVVSRIFGGIKLGRHGLWRAYQDSALLAMEAARLVEVGWLRKLALECSPQSAPAVYALIRARALVPVSGPRGMLPRIGVQIPETDVADLLDEIAGRFGQQVHVASDQRVYGPLVSGSAAL